MKDFENTPSMVRAIQCDNLFLKESLKKRRAPKGLRLFKFPNGMDVNSCDTTELFALFDRFGFDLMEFIVKTNNRRIKVLLDELYKMNSMLNNDLLFDVNSVQYERIFDRVDTNLRANMEGKRKKLLRDENDYLKKQVYFLPNWFTHPRTEGEGVRVIEDDDTFHNPPLNEAQMDSDGMGYDHTSEHYETNFPTLRRSERIENRNRQRHFFRRSSYAKKRPQKEFQGGYRNNNNR